MGRWGVPPPGHTNGGSYKCSEGNAALYFFFLRLLPIYMLYDTVIQLPPGGPGASPATFGVSPPDLLILRSVFWLAFHGAQIR